MADDLDNLIRGAMKTLDGEVPSGYFEALPQRTLARLEDDQSMQTTSSEREPSTGVPPKPTDDSGLHDIRSLADTQKRRLARTSSQPAIDDDVLASTSASWRSIALPEPAKMISLPELAELPAKKIVIAKEKAAKAARAAEPVAAAAVVAPVAAPNKRTRTIALAGIGLAAAAGAVIFVAVQGGGSREVAQQADVDRAAPAGKVAAVAAAAQPAPPPAVVAAAPPVEQAPPPPPETAAVTPEPAPPPVAPSVGKHAPGKVVSPKTGGAATKFDIKPSAGEKPAAPVGKGGKAKDGNGDPSFDDLLKEAGVNENSKKPAAPKLEKKSLSGGDFKQGMSSVAARAQACYAGTQGTATVKLTISPSGHVDKVTVGGAFAGTPVGNCVAAAVQGASFPAWDGAPQSFNYSYLLSE